MPEDPLNPLRKQIDELDHRIVELLNARARIVVDIGKIKHQSGTPVYAPDREKIVLERIRSANRAVGGPLPDSCLEAIYRELMSGSFALEKPLRIAYLGPKGSFSHLASVKKFGSSVEHVPVTDIAAIFKEVDRGHADLGLVPIENSTVGGIIESMDAFLENRSLTIVAEVLIAIHSHLLANCAPEEVKIIYSKGEALNQCRQWITATFPNAQRMAVASSSRAAEMASTEKGAAAIGSALAAELYNLKILFSNIEDNPNNVTRFFIIGKKDHSPRAARATTRLPSFSPPPTNPAHLSMCSMCSAASTSTSPTSTRARARSVTSSITSSPISSATSKMPTSPPRSTKPNSTACNWPSWAAFPEPWRHCSRFY